MRLPAKQQRIQAAYRMTDVTIRPIRRDDAAALIRCHIESRALHAPWVAPCADQPGFDSWFERSLLGATVRLLAQEGSTGEICGVVSLSEIVLGVFQNAYLGYYGMIRTQRRGLMTKAVGKAVHHAFTELGLHRLEANIQPANLRSIALVRRLGFRCEGFSPRYLRINDVWSDCERWALLADAYYASTGLGESC